MWPFSSRKPHTVRQAPPRRSSFRPCLEALEDRFLLAGGVLDPTFGTGGIVNTLVGTGNLEAPRAVATYPHEGTANDGKIVAASFAADEPGSYAVVRYNLNGKLDYSFGTRGQVTTKLGTSSSISANAVAVQPDGKVLAAGYPDLVRYNTDGSPDTSFGKTGEVVLPFAAQAMSLQPDGKIVLAGGSHLERYNANGSPDTSFGTGGTATIPFTNFETTATALVPGTSPLDPNAGKIVVAGLVNGVSTIVRFNTDGSPDTSFGGNGTGYTTISSTFLHYQPAVAIQSDDRIVVAGTVDVGSQYNFGLARLNPDGTLDTTFGSGGLSAPLLPITSNIPRSVALEADGSIVVAGTNRGDKPVLARYNAADGGLDTSFGNNGAAVAGVGNPLSIGSAAMALEPDGRIIVVGVGGIYGAGNTTFVVRFLAAGPEIGSFTANPNPVNAGTGVTLTAANVAALNPDSTVTRVAFYADSNGDGALEAGTDTLLGYAVQTSPGTRTFTFVTTGLTPGKHTLFAQAEDSDGAFSDPLSLALQVL